MRINETRGAREQCCTDVAPALDRSQSLPGWCSLAPPIC